MEETIDSYDVKISEQIKFILLDWLIHLIAYSVVFYPFGMIGFVALMFKTFSWTDAIYYIFLALNPCKGLHVCVFGSVFTFLYLLSPHVDVGECLGFEHIEEDPFGVTDNIFGGMPYCYGKTLYGMIYPVSWRKPDVWYMKPLDDYFSSD